MTPPRGDAKHLYAIKVPADPDMAPTTRDIARRHWLDLADPDVPVSPETREWLRQMALKMIAADRLGATDRREAVYEASGMKGAAYDALRPMILMALRDYERTLKADPGRVAAMSAAEFVAEKLEWDTGHDVAPDSHRKRIMRALDGVSDAEARDWARAVLNGR
jgi:hypothetical protein